MQIRITFSSIYFKYINSSDIPKYYCTFREILELNNKFQNKIILFTKSVMPKRLNKH